MTATTRPAGAAATRERQRYAFEQFMAIRRYQDTLAVAPDGAHVAYSTNVSGQFNLWRQPATGGYPVQLTLYDDQAVREIAWSPDGATLLFTADHHGDEFTRVYRLPVASGVPEELAGGDQVQVQLGGAPFSPDGRQIAYSANDREPTDSDVIIRDLGGTESGRPVASQGLHVPGYWSPDGAKLTYVDFKSNTDMDAYILDLATGDKRHVTAHEGEGIFGPSSWAADGSGFFLWSNEGREFTSVAFVDAASGERRWVLTPDWDVEEFTTFAGGRYAAYVVNEDGYGRLYVQDLGERPSFDGDALPGRPVALPDLPAGTVSQLAGAKDAPVLAFMLARAVNSVEVMTLDLRDGTLTQLTQGMLGGIDPADLVEPELIRYPTHDGRDIPAWLYRPHGDGPFPVVLSIHGGPEWQERANYSGLYQYLLNQGIGVLAPNVRGSTGYGISYQKLIHRDWGGDELKDFKAAAEYLRSLDWVDGDRLGVYGGSFGGFATLSCVSRLPEYWAAAVDIVGPSNLVTFAKAVPPTWRRFMAKWVGDPETEADFLMERSPITYVDRIRAPLFVIQGANDPRVVKPESDQIVEKLRARGVDIEYDVYEDEGHGFTKRTNELKAMRDTAEFFERHLNARA